MRVNNECIKAVLNYVIKKSTIVFDISNSGYQKISFLSIVEDLSSETNYTKEEIIHSCVYALLCNYFITLSHPDLVKFTPAQTVILDVSLTGYQFLEQY